LYEYQLAYWAGLFDGEGSVIIQLPARSLRYFTLRATLANTHEGVVRGLQAAWGGSVSRAHYESREPRILYTFSISGVPAAAFLRAIRPWSVIKAKQIDLGIEFQMAKRDARALLEDERTDQIAIGAAARERLRLMRREA